MERVVGPIQPVDAGAAGVTDLADLSALPSLTSTLAELSSLGPMTARDQLPRVLAWLDAAPATEANATELVRLLDADAFTGLEDAKGQPVKARALLALLRMGYPWALHIKPEDLAWLREHERPRNYKGIIAVALWGVFVIELAALAAMYWS